MLGASVSAGGGGGVGGTVSDGVVALPLAGELAFPAASIATTWYAYVVAGDRPVSV